MQILTIISIYFFYGLVIVPGDATKSKLLQIQSSGGYPGQLSAEELALAKAWIDAGALEK